MRFGHSCHWVPSSWLRLVGRYLFFCGLAAKHMGLEATSNTLHLQMLAHKKGFLKAIRTILFPCDTILDKRVRTRSTPGEQSWSRGTPNYGNQFFFYGCSHFMSFAYQALLCSTKLSKTTFCTAFKDGIQFTSVSKVRAPGFPHLWFPTVTKSWCPPLPQTLAGAQWQRSMQLLLSCLWRLESKSLPYPYRSSLTQVQTWS